MFQFSSVGQLCPTFCDPMDCSTPGLCVHHQLPESTQTHVHWVGDAVQPFHPLSSPSPAFNLSQDQGLFQWVSSLQAWRMLSITLPTKVCLVKALVSPVVMYGYENWTVKKAECQRIDAFEVWCWRRLLRVPCKARRSNQSILKLHPEYSLKGLMLKLKLQSFGHLMRTDSLEKTLMLGKTEGGRRGQQRMRWLDGITDSMDMSLSKLGR